jgi:glycosyltransferase involved in cell wall biosynthesis
LPQWADQIFLKKTLLAAGRLIQLKCFDVLLKAFADLTRRGLDLHLIILGEGPERSRLEHVAHELGLSSRVFMPGFQMNPYPIFARAEVFLLTSRYEGFATVIVEALCLGVPVVASDCPHGPRESLDNGRFGILVPPSNPEALVEAVGSLLASPETQLRLRSLGPKRADEYDVSKVKGLYERVLLESASSRCPEFHGMGFLQ